MALASSFVACEEPEVEDPTRWTVDLHGADVFVYSPGEDGCLTATDERLPRAETVEVLAADDTWYLLAEGFRLIRKVNTLGEYRPDTLRPRTEAIVQKAGPRYGFDNNGCPVAGNTTWEEGQVVTRLARAHDDQFRGFALVSAALELVEVRHVDGWDAPWQAGVRLFDGATDGFGAGGGVLIDETTLLTTAGTGVSEDFCFSRGPDGAAAWEAGEALCTVESVETHESVDLAVVKLSEAVEVPFATLRLTDVAAVDPIYVQRFGAGHARDFGDSFVHSIGLNNADCAPWPFPSTFLSEGPVAGPGDIGSPVYSGGQLVGLVHGDACFPVTDEEGRQAFIHLPALLDFIDEAAEGP